MSGVLGAGSGGGGGGGGDLVSTNNLSDVADAATSRTNIGAGTGDGDVTAGANIADNAVARGDGGAKGVQQSGVTIDDSDNVTGVADLTVTGVITTPAGSTSAVAVAVADADTGLYARAAGAVTVVANGNPVVEFVSGESRMGGHIAIGSSTTNLDCGIRRRGSRSIRIGIKDTATPTDNALQVGEDSRGGTDTDVAGSNGTIQSGAGTGSATGSELIFQTPTPGGSGSTAQTQTTRLSLSDIGLTAEGAAFFAERAAAGADQAGYGQVWVKNTTPCELWYTDDAGTDVQLGAGGGGLSDVVDDTTPQLGGDLDCQGNNIDGGGVIFLNEQASADADVAGDGQWWVKTNTPNLPMFTDDAGTDRTLAPVEGVYPVAGWQMALLQNVYAGGGAGNWQFTDISAAIPTAMGVYAQGAPGAIQNAHCATQATVPRGFDKTVHTLKVRVRCRWATQQATANHDIDIQCYEDGAGADICATAAQAITNAWADYDFTITDTNLVAGDGLQIYVLGILDDTGGTNDPWTYINRVELVVS